ncbi:Very short patch repair protein [uncultured Eubacterium sp.]|nr:Very short patch repair protein [uncultured Eubacterium sp.]
MDIKSPEERSKNMAAIHSKNTKPEIYLRKLLFARGYRYGVNSKSVPGHPDIYLKKYNTAIFVHGCFWHRHEGCKYAYMPKSRVEFWEKKFDTNMKRDAIVQKELIDKKVKVMIVWECTVKRMKKDGEFRKEKLNQIEKYLLTDEYRMEI